MNDPHVERLVYRLESEVFSYMTDAAPVDGEREGFRFHLDNGELTIEMLEHHATERSARAYVEPFLTVWAELGTHGDAPVKGKVRFVFDRSKVVDRQPPAQDEGRLRVTSTLHTYHRDSATLQVRSQDYPAPPSGVEVTAEVDTLVHRLRRFREGGEPLPGFAGFVVSMVDDWGRARRRGNENGRRAAARGLRVDFVILDKLGTLAARRGGRDARKAEGFGQQLTGAEEAWLRAAVELVILRMAQAEGESLAGAPEVGWSDLPPLP